MSLWNSWYNHIQKDSTIKSNWETIQEERPLTDDELLQKANLTIDFEEVAKKEEIDWKQRSKVQWLKHGDKNTIFPQNCNFSQEIQLHGAIRSGWYYYPVSR